MDYTMIPSISQILNILTQRDLVKKINTGYILILICPLVQVLDHVLVSTFIFNVYSVQDYKKDYKMRFSLTVLVFIVFQ